MPIVLNSYYHINTNGHMLNWLKKKVANLEKLQKKEHIKSYQTLKILYLSVTLSNMV